MKEGYALASFLWTLQMQPAAHFDAVTAQAAASRKNVFDREYYKEAANIGKLEWKNRILKEREMVEEWEKFCTRFCLPLFSSFRVIVS